MAITINSKFVKFNYVKYRTVEGKAGLQPYVREDIAEILAAIVNYGSIAFIYGYDKAAGKALSLLCKVITRWKNNLSILPN